MATGDNGEGNGAGSTVLRIALADARRRADSAEQRLRAQTLLFAEAEHKLKTCLSVIAGWAATLDDRWDGLNEDMRRQGVGAIRRAAGELGEQARMLLDAGRADMAALDSAPVRLNLTEALAATTTLYTGVSRAHEVRVEPSGSDVWAWVDPAALQQVIGHLVENAVKYSPGGGTVIVRAFGSGCSAVFEVEDDGVGIPAGIDLFGPFARGPSAAPGAGLGLYIVRNLVEAMGGKVWARRNEGPGSTFRVELPGAGPGPEPCG